MDEKTENNVILEERRRQERYPFTLFILPLFLLVLGSLLYIANNRNIIPPSSSSNTITPVVTSASGRTQVGVGGGPKGVTTPTVTTTLTLTPTITPPISAQTY